MTLAATATVEARSAGPVPGALRSFRRLALVTCAATYLLIWVGGLVRVSGAGLGCPDWPRCFGRFVPPTDVSQLPPDIDPALFNVTLAWIEYINRLVGVSVGFLILATAVLAVRSLRRAPSLVAATAAAALLVAFEGWLGAKVVSTLLRPWVVTTHLVLALVIISLLVWVAVRAWQLEHPERDRDASYPRRARLVVYALLAFAMLQIGFGTQLRGALEVPRDLTPLIGDRAALWGAGPRAHLHLVLGLFFVAAVLAGMRALVRGAERPSWLVGFGAGAGAGLAVLQLALGFGFVVLGVPATLQLFHAWVSSLMIGALVVLVAGLRPPPYVAPAGGAA